LGCGALLAGCSTLGGLQQASDQLAQAKAAGAEQKAPYEYTAAELYLQMAAEQKQVWDWSAASEWAQKSLTYSGQALEKAKGGAQ